MTKNIKNIQYFLNKLNKEILIYSNTFDGSNHKVANKCAKKIIYLFKELEKDLPMAYEIIDYLLCDKNIFCQIWISEFAIDIGYRSQEAIDILMSLLNNTNIGLIKINIKMYLVDKKIIKNWL